MPTPIPQPAYIDALSEIVSDGVATMTQMGNAAGVTNGHISNCLNECREKNMSLTVFQQISAWLVDEKGEVRQLEAFLGKSGGAYLRPDQVELDQGGGGAAIYSFRNSTETTGPGASICT